MFSKSLLAQSRTLCASLKARNSLSVVLLCHASSGKLSMPLQFQRTLSTSLALRSEESRYDDRSSRSRGFRKPVAPSGTLYIGNLPYSITEDELRRAFSEFGEIVRVALGTTPDGMNRGFAHIQFSTVEEANGVIKADNEDPIFLMNRDVYLDHAAIQEKPVHEPYHTLFIRPFEGAEEDLRDVFSDYKHALSDVRILRDKNTGESRRSGFVQFKDVETATEALEALKGQKDPASGREIIFRFAKPNRLEATDDLKSSPEGQKRRFNPKDNSRRRNAYGDDWKGSQRTEDYRNE